MRTVKIINTEGLPHTTKLIDTGTGEVFPSMATVSRVEITIAPDEAVKAEITFNLTQIETVAGARWFLDHVGDNGVVRHREVASITFDDGETVYF